MPPAPSRKPPSNHLTTLHADVLRQRLAGMLAYTRRVIGSLSLADLESLRTLPRNGREVAVRGALAHALAHTMIHAGHMQITRQWLDSL